MDWSQIFYQGWPDITRTLVAGTLGYLALVLFLRISGKRTLAKLNAFDLVVTVALGSILAAIVLQESISLAEGAAGIALLISLQFVVTYLSVRSPGFANLVRSDPSLLVHQGEFCMGTMTDQRVTQDEVLSAIRSSGGHEVTDAQTVILESDGTLSVALRDGSTQSSKPSKLKG